jgi:hypothetical protein
MGYDTVKILAEMKEVVVHSRERNHGGISVRHGLSSRGFDVLKEGI